MKVTVDEHTKGRPEKYPKLMVNRKSERIVLFSSERVGTVVRGVGRLDVGDYFTDFDKDNFTDFHGTITLEND